jgi:6-phosphogluconolactonase (cycloisomerase 2 family)
MIYLGGYSSQAGQGLGVAALPEDVLAVGSTAGSPDDPTFLAVGPGGRTLYVAHELVDGLVSAFAVGDGGKLRLLGSQASGGARPIHVSVHPSGRYLLCANWGSGSIAVLPIDADGTLGATAQVVEHPKPYAHMVVSDPAGRWVLAVHYGVGSVFTYHLDLESEPVTAAAPDASASRCGASAPGLPSRGSGRLCGQRG